MALSSDNSHLARGGEDRKLTIRSRPILLQCYIVNVDALSPEIPMIQSPGMVEAESYSSIA
jgi:hypothetical protein